MATVLNLAAYRFTPLTDLPGWQARVLQAAQAKSLKGTVLLAPEGVNLFMAGPEAAVRAWWGWLQQQADATGAFPFDGMRAKESWSGSVPFRRLRVRLKREIIRMNQPGIMPATGRAPAVEAVTLSRWLDQGHDDEGREVVLLDTRNRFEVEAGTFEGALDWGLQSFSEFPQALAARGETLKGKTVVSFCTGGIRCEKAALVLQAAGLERSFQLEGGILQYFESVPGAPHWHGQCVVFDERGALDKDLSPAADTADTASA